MITPKTLSSLLAFTLLCACTNTVEVKTKTVEDKDYFITDWGSHFLVDKEMVDNVSLELKQCIINTTSRCEKCYGQEDRTAEEIRSNVIECDNAYYNKIRIRQQPPTFYSYPKSEGDPYEDFWMCFHGFSGAYDLSPGTTATDVRASIDECLAYYPSDK